MALLFMLVLLDSYIVLFTLNFSDVIITFVKINDNIYIFCGNISSFFGSVVARIPDVLFNSLAVRTRYSETSKYFEQYSQEQLPGTRV